MSTRPLVPSRTSTSNPLSPPTSTTPTTLVHPTAILNGSHRITLGSRSIIQARSRLDSTYGPIDIGTGSIIGERASIGYLSAPSASLPPSFEPKTVTIGEGVIIESSAIIEASVGAYSMIEAGAKLSKNAEVGARCKVCAMVEITEKIVGDDIVFWGNGWDERRLQKIEKGVEKAGVERNAMVEGMAETLRGVWTGK